jgi:hypothetical protein
MREKMSFKLNAHIFIPFALHNTAFRYRREKYKVLMLTVYTGQGCSASLEVRDVMTVTTSFSRPMKGVGCIGRLLKLV